MKRRTTRLLILLGVVVVLASVTASLSMAVRYYRLQGQMMQVSFAMYEIQRSREMVVGEPMASYYAETGDVSQRVWTANWRLEWLLLAIGPRVEKLQPWAQPCVRIAYDATVTDLVQVLREQSPTDLGPEPMTWVTAFRKEKADEQSNKVLENIGTNAPNSQH